MRDWLKDIRKDRDFTMLEVAEKAGISESYYSMIEGGTRGAPVDTAKKIATALDFDWTKFYEEKEEEK